MANIEETNRVDFVVKVVLRLPSYAAFARLIGVSRYRVGMWKKRGEFPARRSTWKLLSEKTGLPERMFK